MLILLVFLFISFSNTIFCLNANLNELKSYRFVEKYVLMNEKKLIIIREMTFYDEEEFYLCLDPEKLNTSLIKKTNYILLDKKDFTNSLYWKVKTHFLSNQNTIAEVKKNEKTTNHFRILLTTDLCPSTNKMDYDFYITIKEIEKVSSFSIPFIIFFSGKWIEIHKDDLMWLKTNNLNFLAGNHTYHHHIIKDEFSEEKLIAEITNTELMMIKNGIVPSCFFRFPGLKYKKENLNVLAKLNLIPLGVNFWIGQKFIPENSILLVHSNGKMKVEVNMFKKFTRGFKTKLTDGNIRFLSPDEWLKMSLQ
jgi:hypothetical protein